MIETMITITDVEMDTEEDNFGRSIIFKKESIKTLVLSFFFLKLEINNQTLTFHLNTLQGYN
ncbi:Uncharacterised protein [Flavobacterium hibernum]|nr:Uncharacterised protein [Flavobacterium hibernum]